MVATSGGGAASEGGNRQGSRGALWKKEHVRKKNTVLT